VALEPPRLKTFRPTAGGYIWLSAPNEKVHPKGSSRNA
jgi:hypothetical protein